jgi:hypothetical protein
VGAAVLVALLALAPVEPAQAQAPVTYSLSFAQRAHRIVQVEADRRPAAMPRTSSPRTSST